MRLFKLAALAAAALLAMGAVKAVPGRWLTQVAVSPSGSHVLGNPGAAIKLTEFISYTCPHCAHFDMEASDSLKVYGVTQGKISVEVRHLVRDQIDMTAAMLTNCGAPAKFFANHTAFLRSQNTWIAAAGAASPAQQARWSTGDMTTRLRAIANDLGFYAIMAGRGYDRLSVDRCLADRAMAQKLMAQTESATSAGVNATPSFLINGELLAGTHDWASLKAQLDARMN